MTSEPTSGHARGRRWQPGCCSGAPPVTQRCVPRARTCGRAGPPLPPHETGPSISDFDHSGLKHHKYEMLRDSPILWAQAQGELKVRSSPLESRRPRARFRRSPARVPPRGRRRQSPPPLALGRLAERDRVGRPTRRPRKPPDRRERNLIECECRSIRRHRGRGVGDLGELSYTRSWCAPASAMALSELSPDSPRSTGVRQDDQPGAERQDGRERRRREAQLRGAPGTHRPHPRCPQCPHGYDPRSRNTAARSLRVLQRARQCIEHSLELLRSQIVKLCVSSSIRSAPT